MIQGGMVALALHTAACGGGGSFRVSPVEIPKAAAGRPVTTLEGEVRDMPDRFDAELRVDERAGRMMSQDDDRKRVVWVAEPLVEQAEQQGWSTTRFETENILEADWGRPTQRLAAERTHPRAEAVVGPQTTLWLRNHDGREAEVPLGAVDSLAVKGKRSSSKAWIVPVAVGGAVVVGAALVVLTMAAKDGDLGNRGR